MGKMRFSAMKRMHHTALTDVGKLCTLDNKKFRVSGPTTVSRICLQGVDFPYADFRRSFGTSNITCIAFQFLGKTIILKWNKITVERICKLIRCARIHNMNSPNHTY